MIKVYIDLATKMGFTIYMKSEDPRYSFTENIYATGVVNLKALDSFTYQQELKYLYNWLKCLIKEYSDWEGKNTLQFILEKPSIARGGKNSQTGYQVVKKLYGMYGVVSLVVGEYDEIPATTWFKGIRAMYKVDDVYLTKRIKVKDGDKFHYLKNDDGTFVKELKLTESGKVKLDRKQISMTIASIIMDRPITDDNEADAICMATYDNRKKRK